MHKQHPAPHRVVGKSLLVTEEEMGKPQKKPSKTTQRIEGSIKSNIEVSSVLSVSLNVNENQKGSSESKKAACITAENDDHRSFNHRRLEDTPVDSERCPDTLAHSVAVLNSPSGDAERIVDSGKSLSGTSLSSIKKELKSLLNQTNESPKKNASTDSSPVKPCSVKKYDKKETRDYIRKKKLERQEKEQQELLQRKFELETRRRKLMELRDTTLKVLKASIKKRSNSKNAEELEKNWHDLNEEAEKGAAIMDTKSKNAFHVDNHFDHAPLSLGKNNYQIKSKHLLSERGEQRISHSKNAHNDILSFEQSSRSFNPEAVHDSRFLAIPPTKESSSISVNSRVPNSHHFSSQSNKLQSIKEISDKKEFILRLSAEVNRLSSSIKFLKENASRTLLETDKISSKSVDNFERNSNENFVSSQHKPEISKSCQSIPQEMVNAVSELKDTLTLLSQTSIKPASSRRVSKAGSHYPEQALLPPSSSMSSGENHAGAFKLSKRNSTIPKENGEVEKIQSVYQRHQLHHKHPALENYDRKNVVSNTESDHSVSSGFLLDSNVVSIKDSDSEDLSVRWLKNFAQKPNPMNFITTLKSKLNLDHHNNASHAHEEDQKLKIEIFNTLNKKLKESLEKSARKNVFTSESNEDSKSSSLAASSCKPLEQSDLRLRLPTQLAGQAELPAAHSVQKNSVQTEEFSREEKPTKNKNITAKNNSQKHAFAKQSVLFEDGPSLISSQKSTDCVFLPFDIAHFPVPDELKLSGSSSTRSNSKQSSNMLPSSKNEKPLVVPELHLKTNLVSSSSLSSYHSNSNSAFSSTQAKVKAPPVASQDTKPASIRLRQITAADKSSLSSLSDFSEQLCPNLTSKLENKENELPKPKLLDLKVNDSDLPKILSASALRLQAKAELNQIDMYNESLKQLVEAEHYRDLTLAKEAACEQKTEWSTVSGKKDRIRNQDSNDLTNKKKTAFHQISSTPSLTEITDTSTITSEFLSLSNTELKRPNINLKFSADQGINKQSLQMLEQFLKDEEFWANHQKESLKLREKALLNSIKVGIVWFEVQKKQLKESGQEHLIKNLKKKQRGLLLKLQQEKEEIARLQKTIRSASEERKLILLQQYQLLKTQLSTKDHLKRRKAECLPNSKFFNSKQPEKFVCKSINAEGIVCDKNLGQTLLEGLRALEQEKCKISEREQQLIEHSKNVDELLQWKKKFKDLEKHAGSSRPLRDRSTSPFRMTPEPNIGLSMQAGGEIEISLPSQSLKKGQDDMQANQCSEHHNAVLSSKINEEGTDTRSADHYGSESVESPESSETPRQHPLSSNAELAGGVKNMTMNSKQTSMVHIKTPLSPRLQNSRRLRYSSGSDDSLIFSQNETLSEQSETEVRVSALYEQLKQRKLEAERLQREHKRAQRERLKMKEQALIKQIQAYDEYIQKTRRELEQELSQAVAPVVRPQIKQPRVAEKMAFKKQENAPSINTSEPNDHLSRKVPAIDYQKESQESKSAELEDGLTSDVAEPSRIELPLVSEKDLKSVDIPEADELLPTQIHLSEDDRTSHDLGLKPSLKSIKEPILVTGHLNFKPEDFDASDDHAPSKLEEGADSDVSSLKSDLVQSSITARKSAEIEIDISQAGESIDGDKSNFDDPSMVIKRRGSKSASEEVQSEVVEKQSLKEVRTGSDSVDSVSEVSSLPTAQESVRVSTKQTDALIVDGVSVHQLSATSLIKEPEPISDLSAKVIQSSSSGADRTSLIESVSSHVDNIVVASNLESLSQRKDLGTEIVENLESSTQNMEGNETRFTRNSGDSSIKSVFEAISNSSPSSEELSERTPHLQHKGISNDINFMMSSDSSPIVEDKSSNFPSDFKLDSNIDEDWVNADDFFKSNFPSTYEHQKVNSLELPIISESQVQAISKPLEPSFVETTQDSTSEHSGNDTKVDAIKSSEPLSKADDRFPITVKEPSKPIVEYPETDDNAENSDENEEESSRCDSDSVASKTSLSSVKVSESGKSYEKDRSITEIVENYEGSEILDTSSASNDSYKTFDNDFDEGKDGNASDIFSSTFIINEGKSNCESQENEWTPNEMTDKITDAILNVLIQDSFSCIKAEKPINGDKDKSLLLDTVSTLETPFIEALKRDHEALKVKSQQLIHASKEAANVTESSNKLYDAIDVAEMLLSICLKDATKTVLEIRSSKIDESMQSEVSRIGCPSAESDDLSSQRDSCISSSNEAIPDLITSNMDSKGIDYEPVVDDDFDQDWLADEEFAQKEAEKLRLKQLQIEEEIERLQQQAQQQAPYIYERFLREIPNKPPPPYTPPVQPESVPTDENIVMNLVLSAASHIYDSRLIHVEPKPPPSLISDKNISLAIYKKFLYDLCLELINEIYEDDRNATAAPWEKTTKRIAKAKVPTNKSMLIDEIKQKISILFGYRKKVGKENLIIRWSRKKRDHVDELLVREAQEEEQEWTNYEFDEITVKNQVTSALLNSLLNNTTLALSKALKNKLEKLNN